MPISLLVSVFASAILVSTSPQATPVVVKLFDAKGDSIGTATLSPVPGGVRIALAVKGLAPGEHGIHVHQTAKCEGPAFTSAGGHFNPDNRQHGLNNVLGSHAGDMPNFTVDSTGHSTATVVAPGMRLDSGPRSVFAGGGTALVIHEKADDMRSDPAGNAGARVACGVITK
jgi:superoxide dismutase, Cu-Zn family